MSSIKMLTDMINISLVAFKKMRVITAKEESEWKGKGHLVLEKVQDLNDLDVFIRFSKALCHRHTIEKVKEIYPFIPNLVEVGLHDPLSGNLLHNKHLNLFILQFTFYRMLTKCFQNFTTHFVLTCRKL